jgi:hypothetical protein
MEKVAGRIGDSMQVTGSNLLMLRGWMVFRNVIGYVESTAAPAHKELALTYAISNPIEAHVNGFRMALLHGVVSNTLSGVIVSECGRAGGGWGWPISSRNVRKGQASLPLWKRAASSPSAALETDSLRVRGLVYSIVG